MIEAQQAAAVKTSLVAAAFTAWLSGHGKEGESFTRYARRLGLEKEPEPVTEAQKKSAIAKGLAVAEKINAAYRAGKYT